jgi:hypothetical protein
LLDRVFGGLAWLMTSVGTFMVAIGYLGVIDSSFGSGSSIQDHFDMIGYGIIMYAIAAIFVALNRFVKTPR